MASVAPGTDVGGFRVDRLIAAGPTDSVYVATQPSLGRTVALRLIAPDHFGEPGDLTTFDEQQRLAASIHHPNLVPTYEAGEWDGGRFVATRYVRGNTLAELCEAGTPPDPGSLAPLADALAAVHAAGLVHGRVRERNIFVEEDGTLYLADLGLGRPGSPEDDARALAAMLQRVRAQARRTRRGARPRLLIAGALILAGAAAVAAVPALDGDEPAGTESLGCGGRQSTNTPACTLAQTKVEATGVIRSWSVEGGSGQALLQVIRERDGESFVAGFAQPRLLDDVDAQSFPARVPVRAGDLIGVRLSPGAAIGSRAGQPRAETMRWDGGLTADPPRPPDATLTGVELSLQVDVSPGARVEPPRTLLDDAAASAPEGRSLAQVSVALSAGSSAHAAVVELPGGIAVDVFRGRRLARMDVPDAEPEGELVELVPSCDAAGAQGFCLRWQNPGEELPLEHAYRVHPDGRIDLIG